MKFSKKAKFIRKWLKTGLKAGKLKENGYTKKTDPAFVQTRGSTHFTRTILHLFHNHDF